MVISTMRPYVISAVLCLAIAQVLTLPQSEPKHTGTHGPEPSDGRQLGMYESNHSLELLSESKVEPRLPECINNIGRVLYGLGLQVWIGIQIFYTTVYGFAKTAIQCIGRPNFLHCASTQLYEVFQSVWQLVLFSVQVFLAIGYRVADIMETCRFSKDLLLGATI